MRGGTGMNNQKTPLSRSINAAAQRRALTAINTLGRALPCSVVAVSGSIVTVNFELQGNLTLPQVTMPMFGPEYIRYPVQIGDKGVALSADVYIGGMSGLGGGTATETLPANLSALIFFPIANSGWSAPDNPNAVIIYGPDGVIIRDRGKQSHVKMDGSGNVRVSAKTSYAWDVNGYGQKVTFNGGASFTVTNYTQGATVSTVTTNWSPPEIA
jgi:hypothetical protein